MRPAEAVAKAWPTQPVDRGIPSNEGRSTRAVQGAPICCCTRRCEERQQRVNPVGSPARSTTAGPLRLQGRRAHQPRLVPQPEGEPAGLHRDQPRPSRRSAIPDRESAPHLRRPEDGHARLRRLRTEDRPRSSRSSSSADAEGRLSRSQPRLRRHPPWSGPCPPPPRFLGAASLALLTAHRRRMAPAADGPGGRRRHR